MRRSKYGNRKKGGFDSIKEFNRAQELLLLEKIGEISRLETQVPFELVPKQGKDRAVIYKSDFTYYDNTGKFTVEDVKGMRTAVYKLKKRLLLWRYGIRILET